MSFTKKTWKARIAEYANRRTLTKTDGTTETVTVARNEGTISQEGDAFSPDNMNDLETRIYNGFSTTDSNVSTLSKSVSTLNTDMTALKKSVADGKASVASAITNMGVTTASDASFSTMSTNILKLNQVYYLGTGTTFDVKTLCPSVDYTKLTDANFICPTITIPSGSKSQAELSGGLTGTTVTKSYNASTGVLTISGNTVAGWADNYYHLNIPSTFETWAYLVDGNIK